MKNESQVPVRELKIDRQDISPNNPQSASTADMLPENLPGIDIQGGLQRMGDNKVLYRSLLIRFNEHYGDAARRIRNFLNEGETELARQLSHTIKGISGNLSINKVYQAAIALEAQLRDGDVKNAWPFMEQFETALEQVTEALQKLNRKDPQDQIAKTGNCEENSRCGKNFSEIKSRLDELGTCLKENNLEAEQFLEILRKELHGTEAVPVIDELKNQIDLFDFNEARETHKKLLTILEKAYNQ